MRRRDASSVNSAGAFKHLYAELREKFALTADDLPHPPRERMKCSRLARVGAVELQLQKFAD